MAKNIDVTTPATPENETAQKRHVPFAVVEAYKTIRTNLSFLLTANGSNMITVTSPNAGEGKSTTAVNLAIAFSQLGDKVLIVDADMRRASLHKKLKLENKTGLSNVLAGFISADEAIHPINDNLDALTAGQLPPNPSELLGSARFKEFMAEISEKYSYVIIDTPPVNIVSDTLLIAPQTAGMVLVVRDEFTYNDAIKRALSAIEFANINILGAILNGAHPKESRRYHYRKYGYKKYRGYNYYRGYSGYHGYSGYGGYGYGPKPAEVPEKSSDNN